MNRNSKSLRQKAGGLTRSKNHPSLFLSKLGVWVTLTPRNFLWVLLIMLPSFLGHVSRIVELRSQEQVLHTCRNITGVQNVLAFWDSPKAQFPGQSMCQYSSSSAPAPSQIAVPIAIACANPQPTPRGMMHIDFAPKSVGDRYTGFAGFLSHVDMVYHTGTYKASSYLLSQG